MSVLKPWTNIKIYDSREKFVVEVWGRIYTFDNSLFPTSIISKGEELLFEPIKLNMEFNGKDDEIYNCRHDIIEKTDEKVVICSSGLCGNIAVNAAVTIEYDGFINIAVRLIPCGVYDQIETRREEKNIEPILNKAELSIKMKKKASKLFHFWPNTDSSVLVKGVINSGAFLNGNLPFKPCLWIGNEEYGMNFCMESDENIQIADKEKCITMKMHEEYNEIKILLLDRIPDQWKGRVEAWLAPLEPISYEMIIEATPVKKPLCNVEKEWRAYHTYNCEADVDLLYKSGVKWVIFHESWSLIQNFCFPENEEKLRDYIDRCHKLGMKFMVYFGYEYSSAMIDWEKNKNNYLNKDSKGNFTGGWTRQGTYQKAFVVCYNGGYSKEMIDSAVKAMEKYGVDGIYTDGTYVPWECANEAHGCGYRDIEGNLHVKYPIKAVREHVKKLYEEVHKRGGIIDTHQSSCCMMPTMAFCDTYFDGENIQGEFSKGLDKFLNMEAFRCEYMGTNFGIVPNFIAYLNPPEYNIRNVLSISLIHDVMVRPLTEETLKEVSKVWKAYDSMGIEDAEKKMYWQNNPSVKCANEHIYISTFEKKDKILAAISKFSDENKDEEIILPKEFTKAHEIFDGTDYEIKDGKIMCRIDNAKSYMFEITV